MGLGYYYRGTQTLTLYSFDRPLLNADGKQVTGGQNSIAFYNGELYPAGEYVVFANRDGSVAMPTAGPGVRVASSQAGIGDYSLPTVTPSPWETVFVERSDGDAGLPAGLPMELG